MLELLGAYARAIIPDPNEKMAGVVGQFDLYMGTSKTNRVVNQVSDYVLDGVGVGVNQAHLCRF